MSLQSSCNFNLSLLLLSSFFCSDTGESLFLTQSATSASRTVKRHRLSKTQASPFIQEPDDERERDGYPDTRRDEVPSDPDSDADYADLLCKWKSLVKTRGRTGRQPRPRSLRASTKRTVLPFLNVSGSRRFSRRQNKAVVVRMCSLEDSFQSLAYRIYIH